MKDLENVTKSLKNYKSYDRIISEIFKKGVAGKGLQSGVLKLMIAWTFLWAFPTNYAK